MNDFEESFSEAGRKSAVKQEVGGGIDGGAHDGHRVQVHQQSVLWKEEQAPRFKPHGVFLGGEGRGAFPGPACWGWTYVGVVLVE